MKTIEEMVQHLKAHPESNCVIFPYMMPQVAHDVETRIESNIIRIKVENPFFDEDKCEKAMLGSEETLREAPQKLKELGQDLMKHIVNSKEWEDV